MGNQRTLLIVEDDPDILRLLVLVCARVRNVTVDSANDASAALEMLERQTFDVLLTEWHLPGMSGDELIARTTQRYPGMKTVLFSSDHEVRYAARTVGADGAMAIGGEVLPLCSFVSNLLSARHE